MIPDFQTVMRPVLECASKGEARIRDVIDELADSFGLSVEEKEELVPSGRQTRFANRVHWAKTYLKQAGLIQPTKRGHFTITDRGREALGRSDLEINTNFLEQFGDFAEFRTRTRIQGEIGPGPGPGQDQTDNTATPDEVLRATHNRINSALAVELLDRVISAPPGFLEKVILRLLLAMGYGGTSEEAGKALGGSGDDGVDGVIDQDPLGVDQVYVQAKRYALNNTVGPSAIRDFFGAINLKRAQKGIFITTSSFSQSAIQTAKELSTRMVLIDGEQLARLMIRYNIGCRDEDVLHVKRIDEDFFE